MTFASPFSTYPPNVTIVGVWNTFAQKTTPGVCCGDHITESADHVGTAGFTAMIQRTDQPGFGQQIHIQWLACPASTGTSDTTVIPAIGDETEEEMEEETEDTYLVGFCNVVRCPTPGMQENFGYALRTTHLGEKNCDRAWPGPLAPTPLLPSLREDGVVVLKPQAVTNDGIVAPIVTGQLEVLLRCDPTGESGVATPLNASLISMDPASPLYVPHRLELSSRCACAGGCPRPSPSPMAPSSIRSAPAPLAANATMPSDGSFIVRLSHLFGSAEGLGEYSAPATVDLASTVFCGQQIVAVQEVSLSANQKIGDVHHWHWQRKEDGRAHRVPAREEGFGGGDDGTSVVLQPLSTRTFVVTVV